MAYCKKCGGRMELRPNGKYRTCLMCGLTEKEKNKPKEEYILETKFWDINELLDW